MPGLGDPGDCLAVATVEREGHVHALTGPTANLEAVAGNGLTRAEQMLAELAKLGV